MMGHDDNLEQVLRRHRAFWAMEDVDGPLLSVGWYEPLQRRQPFRLADGSLTQEGTRLLPELMDAHHLVEQQEPPSAVVSGGFIQASAPYDLCWNEAIAGCPIHWKTGHVWSEPFLNDVDDLERLRVVSDNPWLNMLLEMTRLLVEQAEGRYPVCLPLLRGPIDIASALIGDESLCWTIVDEPVRFKHLLEVCTQVFITVAKAWAAVAPPFQGGSCEYGIWAPGRIVRLQADNAALLSPRLYRDFLLPCDARICAAFDYPLIHTHSGVLHIMVDALLALEPLRAIQVSMDYPGGPPLAELLPLFRQINAHKPLIITGPVSQSELDILLQSLSPRGVCLQVTLHSD